MIPTSCNPADLGLLHHETTLQSGLARVIIAWDWDGVSVPPTCNGPLVSVRATNGDTVSHWVHFQGRSGNPKSIEMPPGTDVTLLPQQLHPRGFDTLADTVGVQITDSPDTPLASPTK